jgi:hypothetical protein
MHIFITLVAGTYVIHYKNLNLITHKLGRVPVHIQYMRVRACFSCVSAYKRTYSFGNASFYSNIVFSRLGCTLGCTMLAIL